MSYDRNLLPDPIDFYDSQGLRLSPRGKWRKAICPFHDDKNPSLSVNAESGAFACFSCGTKGGDVLSFLLQRDGLDFITAVKQVGAWVDDGKPANRAKPNPLPARDALYLLKGEAQLIAVAGANIAHGVSLSQGDKDRILKAAGRINMISEVFV